MTCYEKNQDKRCDAQKIILSLVALVNVVNLHKATVQNLSYYLYRRQYVKELYFVLNYRCKTSLSCIVTKILNHIHFSVVVIEQCGHSGQCGPIFGSLILKNVC